MKNFLSCDWGTSSFRLRYVDVQDLSFRSVESADHGIAATFKLWKQSGKKEEERFSFYINIIKEQIRILEQQLKFPVKDIPLVISGMASSSIGMMELSYKEAPFAADGSELNVKKIKHTGSFDHDILIISGAKTANDVMRGEETQLAGCTHHTNEEGLFIFPGTHSKHILVKSGRVTDFKTYMTGEFFDILSKKSLLAGSVEETTDFQNIKNQKSFKEGVNDSRQSNLLHTSFHVRSNDLFGKLNKEENYYYLSGLLIGTELNDLKDSAHKKITLVANHSMKLFYAITLEMIGIKNDLTIEDADQVLVKGQFRILRKHEV